MSLGIATYATIVIILLKYILYGDDLHFLLVESTDSVTPLKKINVKSV